MTTPASLPVTITDAHPGWLWIPAGTTGAGTLARVFGPNENVSRAAKDRGIEAFEAALAKAKERP